MWCVIGGVCGFCGGCGRFHGRFHDCCRTGFLEVALRDEGGAEEEEEEGGGGDGGSEGPSREILKPENLAKASPTIFWSLVR